MMVKNPNRDLVSVTYDGVEHRTPWSPEMTQPAQAEQHRNKVRVHLLRTSSWRLLPSWEVAA